MKINSSTQKLPNWKKFLSLSANKVALTAFLAEQWRLAVHAKHLQDRSLYMCIACDCYMLTSADGADVRSTAIPALHCSQEEADTRLLLHACHAATNGSAVVIVRSPDTDVAVIGCSLARDITARLLLQTGTKQHRRLL